jgi:dTDP-6-deoxy-L-talose 4-dehydrogenase (NAD+)
MGRIRRIAVALEDEESIRSVLAETRPDTVIHLAWYTKPHDYLVSEENLRSLATTVQFVRTAFAAGCRKVVIAGTCLEYSTSKAPHRESDRTEPHSLYGSCKHAAHVVCEVLARRAGAELAWGRVFHLHGPGEDPVRLIPMAAARLRQRQPVDLTAGEQLRDHLNVDDVAAAFVALARPGISGTFNICSGQRVTLRHVMETVGEIVGGGDLLRFGRRPYPPDEAFFVVGDSTALRAIGWRPRYESLRDSLMYLCPPPMEGL